MVLNGRKSFAVENRMKELKVDLVVQGISDKRSSVDYMKNSGMTKYCAGYIGDDLNDFEPMKVAGLVCCPGDACDETSRFRIMLPVPMEGMGQCVNVSHIC